LEDDKIKKYDYTRKYKNKNGEVKEYTQHQEHLIAGGNKSNELQRYINDTLKIASKKVYEIEKIEKILKTVLRYRGYNQKNLYQRIYKLESANEINMKDKKLLTKIMNRQKMIAGDLTEFLEYIIQLYGVHDAEIKELTKELKEYEKKWQ